MSDINLFCNSTSKGKGKHAVSSCFVAPLSYFSSLDFTSLSNKGKHAFSTVSTSFVSYVRFWNLRTLLILNPIRVIWHCRVILVAIPRGERDTTTRKRTNAESSTWHSANNFYFYFFSFKLFYYQLKFEKLIPGSIWYFYWLFYYILLFFSVCGEYSLKLFLN